MCVRAYVPGCLALLNEWEVSKKFRFAHPKIALDSLVVRINSAYMFRRQKFCTFVNILAGLILDASENPVFVGAC